MSEGESNDRTILDYLNEDCWRIVLRDVPIPDIVRSERVSRRWQRVVLQYLRGTRFSFSFDWDSVDPFDAYPFYLPKSMYESFEMWTTKLGSSVIGAYCKDRESLKTLIENCPNLEALTLVNLEEPEANTKEFPENLLKNFWCLKQICFFNTCNLSDRFVSQNIADKVLEELVFYQCYEVTGECLTTANLSKLKYLAFKRCFDLRAAHLISSTNQLGELTKLELIGVSKEISQKIQFVLDKMPKLEHLEIHTDAGRYNGYLETYEPICRLSSLTHLRIDLKMTDESVEAITRCCKQLETLDLGDCEFLNSEGLEAIGRNAGERLTQLGLQYFCDLEDDDVVNYVRSCPALGWLTIIGTCQITPALPALVSAARHEVCPGSELVLDISETKLTDPYYRHSFLNEDDGDMEEYEDIQEKYEDLAVILD
ncbi:F-box/LRR-repeat protein fbxl-1-like [Leguminivora glycinivorella]|uniref:F-box/LRR-repeat protein fbxl-1-like n=1 Tax=Leguminivora glycinivorella TaxID=1035111 RepID=UPI00200D5765|nr:F-box/LRR-repeat protein fbxl-1-like [Leguminivora glycinivorella]